MKNLLIISCLIPVMLTACGSPPPLPTATPTATLTPIPSPTQTITPTLEPWMASLPKNVTSVQVEGENIFGLDSKGNQVMIFDVEKNEWVEVVSYAIVREAGKESQMSTVEWGVNSHGGVGIPAEYIDFLRENMLPGKLTDEQAATINYLEHWWGSKQNLEIGIVFVDFSLTESMQMVNVCRVSLEPWGVAEQGYLMTYQYTNADNSQSLVHFLLTEPYYQQVVDKGIYDGQQVIIASAVIGPSDQSRRYPDEKYNGMVENFYVVQLGDVSTRDARKHMEGLVAEVNRSNSFVGEPEQIIWSPAAISP